MLSRSDSRRSDILSLEKSGETQLLLPSFQTGSNKKLTAARFPGKKDDRAPPGGIRAAHDAPEELLAVCG